MLVAEREAEILTIIHRQGVATVHELAERLGVTDVTIRRDLTRLESLSLLRRTHGGAVSLEKTSAIAQIPAQNHANTSENTTSDALIIGPVQNRAAHTLRERALRNHIPLIAESSPQTGAIYLGPNNFEATLELGRWTGNYTRGRLPHVAALDITHADLANTRERSAGFIQGLTETLGNQYEILSVNGHGLYNDAYQVASDALRLHPTINVIFGINDDSVLGGIQAYLDLGRDPGQLVAVSIGVEGKTILDVLHQNSVLRACVALFPEVVGRLAVDATLRLWQGQDIGQEILTPYSLLTPDNLADYYIHTRQGWELRPDTMRQIIPDSWQSPPPPAKNKRLSFVIHYRTHEWYQNVAKAIQERSRQFGIAFAVQDVNDDINAEIRELRRLIGKVAASYINDGETIILDTGTTTSNLAQFLHGYSNLTIITNSIDVFQQLRSQKGIKLNLTGGEFDAESHSFVGRGAHLPLREIRADKAFIVAGGVSKSFGVSSVKAEEAEVRRSMIAAAREVIVLADHTVLDTDSKVRVTGLEDVDTLITDAGVLSSQSLELAQLGIKVIIAGQVTMP